MSRAPLTASRFRRCAELSLLFVRGSRACGRGQALAQQLEQAYTSLMETTNEMAEDRKAAQTTTNEEYVKKLVNRTSTVVSIRRIAYTVCFCVALMWVGAVGVVEQSLQAVRRAGHRHAASDAVQVARAGRHHTARLAVANGGHVDGSAGHVAGAAARATPTPYDFVCSFCFWCARMRLRRRSTMAP